MPNPGSLAMLWEQDSERILLTSWGSSFSTRFMWNAAARGVYVEPFLKVKILAFGFLEINGGMNHFLSCQTTD